MAQNLPLTKTGSDKTTNSEPMNFSSYNSFPKCVDLLVNNEKCVETGVEKSTPKQRYITLVFITSLLQKRHIY
jgi:hypothetical protein